MTTQTPKASLKLLLTRSLLRFLALFSLRYNQALGAFIGYCLYWIPNRLTCVADINLRLCYPAIDTRTHQQLLSAHLRETGKTLTELAALWYWPRHKVNGLVRSRSGWELVEQACASGRGLILLTPHFGSWELGGIYSAQRLTMTHLYRPARQTHLQTWIKQRRERDGAKLVPTDASGIRALYRALSQGEAVGVLPDQEPPTGAGVFASFMGVPAYTMTLVNRLARKTQAPVLIGVMERLPKGKGFHLHFQAVNADIYSANPETAAEALNQAIAQSIAINPAQYMWNYKRFRHLPDGSKRTYR